MLLKVRPTENASDDKRNDGLTDLYLATKQSSLHKSKLSISAEGSQKNITERQFILLKTRI